MNRIFIHLNSDKIVIHLATVRLPVSTQRLTFFQLSQKLQLNQHLCLLYHLIPMYFYHYCCWWLPIRLLLSAYLLFFFFAHLLIFCSDSALTANLIHAHLIRAHLNLFFLAFCLLYCLLLFVHCSLLSCTKPNYHQHSFVAIKESCGNKRILHYLVCK